MATPTRLLVLEVDAGDRVLVEGWARDGTLPTFARLLRDGLVGDSDSVDGFFVGLVDEFDGAFQKLALNSGRHKVEVRAEGFETAEFDVLISPEQTVTFQGELKRIQ